MPAAPGVIALIHENLVLRRLLQEEPVHVLGDLAEHRQPGLRQPRDGLEHRGVELFRGPRRVRRHEPALARPDGTGPVTPLSDT